MDLRLEMENVSKTFDRPLYHNVSFHFETGVYAIVGSNGVGKTALLEMLAGISRQDSGSIILNGFGSNQSIEYKKQLAYVPAKTSFFPSATGKNFLDFMISIKNNRTDDLSRILERFSLISHLNKKFSEMSLGTQKKLFLSTIAMGFPKIIILDEPTNGLDTNSISVLCDLLIRIASNSIVIFSTHDEILIKNLQPHKITLNHAPITEFTIG